MKTNTNKTKKTGLPNRPEQSSNEPMPKLDFAKRLANRQLPTEEVVNLLAKQAPLLCRLATVVGSWIWIEFEDKQPHFITSLLSQLGFHWNRKRCLWQHPCGVFCDQAATYDPRQRYGSRSAGK